MNLQQIKEAVDKGKTVKWSNDGYDVIKDGLGQYLIVYRFNKHCIGLTGQKGTKYENILNGNEEDFYIKKFW